MKFCPQCGSPLGGSEKFCPKCGRRLTMAQAVPEDLSSDTALKSEASRKGIIFTDTKMLSQLLGYDRKEISSLLCKYAELMKDADTDYRTVDVSDYVFVSDGAGRKGERPTFDESSPWWDYQQVLYDVMCHEREKGLKETNYVFIIGGHEIIPVPAINHYLSDDPSFSDRDIETDILYSYPYGPKTQYSLESGEIYKMPMQFFVGRLPIPQDADISYLVNYLQNALDCRRGIGVKKIYAQSDPHWKELTSWIMSPYNRAGMLPDRSNISGKYSYGNVMLGPDVTSRDINSVLDTDTDLIYLNLHGSKAPEMESYAGEYPQHTTRFVDIFPVSAMKIPEHHNVFIAEACYGGRFIGYPISRSMIQAGLSHKTIIGLASSRIAFGGFEAPGGNADTLCRVFTARLLEGYCSGDAFALARAAFFEKDSVLDPYRAATLAEFNLYGDPTLFAVAVGQHSGKAVASGAKMAPQDYPVGYESQMLKSAGVKEASILERIRNAVDSNIMEFSRTIGCELYDKYGLTPREPQTVKKLKYSNGRQTLVYTYDNKGASWIVTTSPQGKIESVMTTK